MNEFTITFVGIVMFLSIPFAGVPDARHVVLPFWGTEKTVKANGSNETVEAHVPYIAFTTAGCDEPPCATLGELAGEPVPFTRRGEQWQYIKLEGYHLEVDKPRHDLRVTDAHRQKLPRLREYCDTFVLPPSFAKDDLKDPRKAATIDITAGTLSAEGNISFDEGVMSVWKTVVPRNLIIYATPHHEDPANQPADAKKMLLELKPGTRVEIGNAPRAFIENPTHRGHASTQNHFLVYYAVSDDDATRAAATSTAPVTRCNRKPGRHNTLPSPNRGRLPSADCSNTQYP